MSETAEKICGIVMPISECDGRKASHWSDVRHIVELAAKEAGFNARLVSDTFESNLIHKEILQNIYQDDIIICDVSGRNPNVFFELGIRMATQKPTVIIKDNVTAYPFDTGPNRYIEYPSDLRHPGMEQFKAELIKALQKTINHGEEQSFIGQLGPFSVPDVKSTTLPEGEIILKRLDKIERNLSYMPMNKWPRLKDIARTEADMGEGSFIFEHVGPEIVTVRLRGFSRLQVETGLEDLRRSHELGDLKITSAIGSTKSTLLTFEGPSTSRSDFQALVMSAISNAIPF